MEKRKGASQRVLVMYDIRIKQGKKLLRQEGVNHDVCCETDRHITQHSERRRAGEIIEKLTGA